MGNLIEHVVEMSLIVGMYLERGKINKEQLDLSSTDIVFAVHDWAKEFEERYASADFTLVSYSQYEELGNPVGYLAAIDAFVDIKCEQVGWFK
jgi:hypothetical protein